MGHCLSRQGQRSIRLGLVASGIGMFVAGYLVISRKNDLLGLLLAGATLHFAIYSSSLPFYGWYYIPEALGVSLLGASAIYAMSKAAAKTVPYAGIAAALAATVFLWQFVRQGVLVARLEARALESSQKVILYNAFGKWLAQNTTENDSV